MSRLLSKCGMDCRICPWGPHPRRDMAAEEFEQYKKKAKEILGYTPMKTPCFTCQTPDEEIPKGSKLPPRSCLVRQCVDKTGVLNCAYCSRFPCEHAKDTGGAWNRQKIEEKLGRRISEEDYHTYVEPFEALPRLKSIRASLKAGEIVKAPEVPPIKIEIVDFPERSTLPQEETAAFRAVHHLLAKIESSSFGLEDIDVFAQQHRLKKRIPHFLRFLWVLSRFGNLIKEDGSHVLVVDAKNYLDNRGSEKTLASWPFVKDVILKTLSEFGVHCELVASKGVEEKNLTTPGGYLRNKGWTIRLSLDAKAGGFAALNALKIYTKQLDDKYGAKAFRYFSNADMHILDDR